MDKLSKIGRMVTGKDWPRLAPNGWIPSAKIASGSGKMVFVACFQECDVNSKSPQTMSKEESDDVMGQMRNSLSTAHLMPGVVCHGWNYQDAALIERAGATLEAEGIDFTKIKEAAPMVFWYFDADGEMQLHDWTDQKPD